YTLWARPRNAADNDIFRTAVDLTTPSASTWTALGAVPNVKGTGFLSMIISGVLASGVAGDGLVMYLIGRTPFGGPANVPLRTYFPKTVTEATWNRHFLPSMPVDSSSGVPGGSPPESTFPFSGNRDVIIDSFASSSTLGRLIVVRDFNSPTRLLTWTDTVAFLKAPVLSAPADGAIVERSKPLTLSWSALPQGVTYQFEVATDAAFNNRVGGGFGFGNASCPSFGGFTTFDPLAPGTNTPFTTIPEFIRLQAGVQHFWRARVCGVEISSNFGPDQRYHPGPWSAARSFTVAPDPTIALTPTSGKPGDTVSFAIANMPPGEILKVTWDNPFTALVNVTSGTDGKATGSFVVPAGSPVGPHLVFAQTALLCCKSAAASFDLLSATAPGSATFTGQVQIGTAAAPTAPPSGYAVQVKIFPAGSTTAQASPAVQTDGTGTFSVTIVNLPAGAYDIAVKGHHTLTNKKANVTLPATGTTPVSFGVLLTGDLNSDDAIQGGDYSVLVTNFSKTGPQTVAGAATRLLAEAAGSVTLRLLPQFDRAEAGQVFSVGVVARTGDQPVDAVDLLLRFNAAILQLVDEEGNPVEMVAAGNALPVVLRNRADSEAGWVAFSAGRDPAAPAPAGDLAVATLRFRALVPISGAALPMALAGLEGSGAYYSGYQLLRPE
ncbi:MAG: hypothetical protein HYY02_04050, partial [Chloroflexi bacterium]|nr:hypothetical protein [Chloroflexota bacterium]